MHMTIPLKELQAALKAVAPATKGTPRMESKPAKPAPAIVVPKPPVVATPLQDRSRMAWAEQPNLFGEGVA